MELWQKVENVSSFFSDNLSNAKQEVVRILLTNSPDFIITYLAILHAGHIALPLDPAFKKLEIDAIIDQIPAKFIITQKRYQDKIGTHQAKIIMVEDLLKHKGKPKKLLRLPSKDQISSLTFTSGTTGKPKTVPSTHKNTMWNIKVCSEVWEWTDRDTMLLALPLSHWYGLVMGLTGSIYHGNTLYLRDQAFDATEIMEELNSGKITLFTHVPGAFTKMLDIAKKDYDFSKVRLMISGGGALPPIKSAEFKQIFGADIIETYGSSETGRIAANPLKNRKTGTPGKLLSGVRAKIDKNSELLIKSPGLFPGYYKNAAATKKGWAEKGYWRTGDIAEIKDDYVYLKGRVQEKIRKYGYTVSPRDVEWAMHKNSKIKAIHVLGRQVSGSANDELIYFIVGNISHEELTDYCKQNLLFAWRPDDIIFLDKLPLTQTGKPKISALRAMLGVAT